MLLRWLEVMTHLDGEIALFNDAAFGHAATPTSLAACGADLGALTKKVPLSLFIDP